MIDVLHHWLAATVIANPLTAAMPATHMPSPPRKLASLGTVARTKPSPPANHAQPARVRRLSTGSRIPASGVAFRSGFRAAPTAEEETPDASASWLRARAAFGLRCDSREQRLNARDRCEGGRRDAPPTGLSAAGSL